MVLGRSSSLTSFVIIILVSVGHGRLLFFILFYLGDTGKVLPILCAPEAAIAINAAKRCTSTSLDVNIQLGLFQRLLTTITDERGHPTVFSDKGSMGSSSYFIGPLPMKGYCTFDSLAVIGINVILLQLARI